MTLTQRGAGRCGGQRACGRPEVARAPSAALVRGGLWVLLAGAGSCVSTYTDADPMQPAVTADPVVIELGPDPHVGEDPVLRQFYESVLARLQSAHKERDLETMRALVGSYLRDGMPEWARQRLLGFRALAAGLALEQHMARKATLVASAVPAEAPAPDAPAADAAVLGMQLQFDLSVPPLADAHYVLGARDAADPVAFRVEINVRDHYLDGSSRDHSDGDIVRLDREHVLSEAPLSVPVRIDLGGGEAVRREIDVRIDLLPGYVRADDDRAPVRNTTIAAATVTQWPVGYQALRAAPLQAFEQALQQATPASFARVRLAAEFAATTDRAKVEEGLIGWVRLGSQAQAVVAMASLRAIGSAQIAVGDRDAWLAWWQGRR